MDSSNNALIASLTLNRVVAWKVLSRSLRGSLVPVGYGSRATIFKGKATPGSTLWIVSTLSSGNLRMRSLVARVRVQRVVTRHDSITAESPAIRALRRQWGHVAVADPEQSEFFGLNDATGALHALGADLMRNMERVPAKQATRAFSRCATQSRDRGVFISYRHGERAAGQKFALALARELVALGASPWLDALSIPLFRSKTEASERSDHRLNQLLHLGVRTARLAVVVATPNYRRSEWTRRERRWIHARRRADPGFRCVQIERGASVLRYPDANFAGDDPVALAREIVQ